MLLPQLRALMHTVRGIISFPERSSGVGSKRTKIEDGRDGLFFWAYDLFFLERMGSVVSTYVEE